MRRGMKESQQIRHESTCHHSSKCIYKCDDHVPRSCDKSNDTQRGVCLLTVCQLVVKASHVRINNNSKICLLQKNSQKKKKEKKEISTKSTKTLFFFTIQLSPISLGRDVSYACAKDK